MTSIFVIYNTLCTWLPDWSLFTYKTFFTRLPHLLLFTVPSALGLPDLLVVTTLSAHDFHICGYLQHFLRLTSRFAAIINTFQTRQSLKKVEKGSSRGEGEHIYIYIYRERERCTQGPRSAPSRRPCGPP